MQYYSDPIHNLTDDTLLSQLIGEECSAPVLVANHNQITLYLYD